jgi:hypothetical protein
VRRSFFVGMSLNRQEQRVFDYLQTQVDERRHWEGVVRREAVSAGGDRHAAAVTLERALWAYYEERSAVVEPFRSEARREGLARTSMKTLAELLLRLWAPPPPTSTQNPSSRKLPTI